MFVENLMKYSLVNDRVDGIQINFKRLYSKGIKRQKYPVTLMENKGFIQKYQVPVEMEGYAMHNCVRQ